MIRKLCTNQPVRHLARSLALRLVHWLGTGHAMAQNLPVGRTGKFKAAASDASCEMSHTSPAQWPRCGQRRNRWLIQPRQRSGHFASHQSPTEHHVTVHEPTRKTTRENPIGELAGHLGADPTACPRCCHFFVLTEARTVCCLGNGKPELEGKTRDS
jgi:hypothetical protein